VGHAASPVGRILRRYGQDFYPLGARRTGDLSAMRIACRRQAQNPWSPMRLRA